MLAITNDERISLVEAIQIIQYKDKYFIKYNDDGIYGKYDTKKEAMVDFVKLASKLKGNKLKIVCEKLQGTKLKIVCEKLQELADISEKDNE